MGFAYSILLKMLYPTSMALLLLLASAFLRRRAFGSQQPGDPRPSLTHRLSTWCFWLALSILLICGNGWVVGAMTRHLESQYPPLQDHGPLTKDHGPQGEVNGQLSVVSSPSDPQLSTLNSQPQAHPSPYDCILVLSGGIYAKDPPRPTVELGEAGDRLLYGAYLFRQGKAPQIICTGNVATGGTATRPISEDMAEFLQMLGIPEDAILTECKSENTYQHAKYLYPIFKERGYQRVLLVTSALHMPRSMAVFRRNCPGIEFTPAPTDFRSTRKPPIAWYRHIVRLIPTPSSLLAFNEAAHEYLGLAYYKLRGWI